MAESRTMNTQMAVAKASGVAQSYLSRVIRGESAATLDTVQSLARAFGCEPWELLTDSEQTRRVAIERMIIGPAADDVRVKEAQGSPRRSKQ